jgi:hypothetical protein
VSRAEHEEELRVILYGGAANIRGKIKPKVKKDPAAFRRAIRDQGTPLAEEWPVGNREARRLLKSKKRGLKPLVTERKP